MRFSVLHSIVGSEAETAYEPIQPEFGEAPRCPRCGLYVGMKTWLPPYRVRLQVFGNRVGDAAFGTGDDLLISDAFMRGWFNKRLRGLHDVLPVEVVQVQPKSLARRVEPFYRVAARRGGAAIDATKTRIVRQGPRTCDMCAGAGIVDAVLGIQIAEDTWRGDDLFMPSGLNGITVVTDRVESMASEYDLLNVTTTPVEAYRWDPLGKAPMA